MATSNSFDYSLTANDIITDALENIGALPAGEPIQSEDQTTALRSLNMMVKQWSANFDFAPGLKAFSRKHGYVFMQKDQGVYNIGPTGDNASLSYVSTTMRVAGTATATTLEITSSTGMTAADKIGILLDSGTIQWTTISSVTDGDTIVIPASGLTSAAAAGNRIFTYTTKLIRPLIIEDCQVRDVTGNDTTIYPMTTQYYEGIGVKNADGFPTYYRYDNTLTNGTLYFDVQPSDATNVAYLTFLAPSEDYDSATDSMAYPQEWYMALSQGLSKLIAPKFGHTWTPSDEDNYKTAVMMARASYAETSDMYFQPGLE
jgi:hypothetical protein